MTDINLIDTMDDSLIENVCQDIYQKKDYLSLYHFIQTNKRVHRICQKYLDQVHQNIVIMIASVGECHEDSMPVALITLDKFKKFLAKAHDHGYEFYVTIMIPNKSIADEGDFFMTLETNEDENTDTVYLDDIQFNWNNFDSYMKMIEIIKTKYEQKHRSKDIY